MNTGRIITTALAASILAIPAMAEAPGYFKVPGTETTMKVYGRAQSWAFYDMSKYSLPSDDSLGKDQSWFEKGTTRSVVKGRFGVTSTTPSAYGDVNVKLEYEAKSANEANSGSLNLRHAYGEFAGVLIGQTDSLFSQWHNCPGYLDTWNEDFAGTNRARQIRYTFTPTNEIKLAFAMEQDWSGGDSTKLGHELVGAFQYGADWGNVTASVATMKKRDWTKAETTSGSGVSYAISGAWNITPNDNLVARIIKGGKQFGNMDDDGFVSYNDKYKFYTTTSFDLGYAHTWNDQFTSNVGVGQISHPKSEKYDKVKYKVTEFFVNTTWNITKNCQFGAEYFMSQIKVYGENNEVFSKYSGGTASKAKQDGFNLMFTYNLF